MSSKTWKCLHSWIADGFKTLNLRGPTVQWLKAVNHPANSGGLQ